MEFIKRKEISSILYVGEDLNIKDFKLNIKNTKFKDFRDIFFRKVISLNIPVKFGSFKFDKKLEMKERMRNELEMWYECKIDYDLKRFKEEESFFLLNLNLNFFIFIT